MTKSFSLFFADCPMMIDANFSVVVVNDIRSYGATGKLVCSNDGALFVDNTAVEINVTCDVTAEWTWKQEDVKCYTSNLKIKKFSLLRSSVFNTAFLSKPKIHECTRHR